MKFLPLLSVVPSGVYQWRVRRYMSSRVEQRLLYVFISLPAQNFLACRPKFYLHAGPPLKSTGHKISLPAMAPLPPYIRLCYLLLLLHVYRLGESCQTTGSGVFYGTIYRPRCYRFRSSMRSASYSLLLLLPLYWLGKVRRTPVAWTFLWHRLRFSSSVSQLRA